MSASANNDEAATIGICTRNRGAVLRMAVESVLKCAHDNYRVMVVDQSTNDESERSIDHLRNDERLSYVRSSEVGVSRARNQVLRVADTEVVAFTDDDCEVPQDWLSIMQSLFEGRPKLALAYCTVRAGPHDASAGYVPAYECPTTRFVTELSQKRDLRGIGAGLAVRREATLGFGGFDEELGPGSTFRSGEDRDLTIRALLAGLEVCETDRTFVVHHGFRTWAECRALGRRDWIGIGAAYSKPIAARHWSFVPIAVHEVATHALWPPIRDALQLKRPQGVLRSVHFAQGFVQGLLTPIDDRHARFWPKAASSGTRGTPPQGGNP